MDNELLLQIELTTKCTIECPGCPRTYKKKEDNTTWDYGHIDKQIVFDQIESNDYHKLIFAGAYGDPIYHPDFIEIMDRATKFNKRIKVETNGSFKKRKWWEQLSELPWTDNISFNFSIDGLEDTNHIYRKNSRWKDIVQGIETLVNAKQRPKLIWQMLIFPYNEHQVEEAQTLSKQLGFDEFHSSKSLRNYAKWWFESEQERKSIVWNYS